MRENEGVAARILLDFDADSEKIRNEVIRALSKPALRQDADAASEPAFPDLGTLSDTALDDLIDELLEQERAISYSDEYYTARSTS